MATTLPQPKWLLEFGRSTPKNGFLFDWGIEVVWPDDQCQRFRRVFENELRYIAIEDHSGPSTLRITIHKILFHELYQATYHSLYQVHYWLVVWNMFFIFPYIGNVIVPTDELIFFRGVETTINQVTIHQFCVLIFLAVSESFAARYEDRPDRADRPRSLLPSFDTVLNETPRQSFSLTYQDKDGDRSRHWQVTVFISHYMWLFCTNFPCVFG